MGITITQRFRFLARNILLDVLLNALQYYLLLLLKEHNVFAHFEGTEVLGNQF
jgi:hypothetical protein